MEPLVAGAIATRDPHVEIVAIVRGVGTRGTRTIDDSTSRSPSRNVADVEASERVDKTIAETRSGDGSDGTDRSEVGAEVLLDHSLESLVLAKGEVLVRLDTTKGSVTRSNLGLEVIDEIEHEGFLLGAGVDDLAIEFDLLLHVLAVVGDFLAKRGTSASDHRRQAEMEAGSAEGRHRAGAGRRRELHGARNTTLVDEVSDSTSQVTAGLSRFIRVELTRSVGVATCDNLLVQCYEATESYYQLTSVVVSVETVFFGVLARALLLPPEASQVLDAGATSTLIGRVGRANDGRKRSGA